ncbi:MAG: ribonuclease P protein component [Chloroflexi bacterium]|nr:ribonuclease P protein component [Chloroflexota bacterium]
MNRTFRLTQSADFKKVKETGKVYLHPLVKMAICPNGLPNYRFAIVTSKLIGNAVIRNRCRRRLRAILNRKKNRCQMGWDIVFIVRKRFIHSSASEIQTAVENLFLQAGLV